MYRADVHRITELARQLDELRADAAELERRADALDRELRQLRAGGSEGARRAALGLALGFGPFLVMGVVLLTMGREVWSSRSPCGREAWGGDSVGSVDCAAPVADAVPAVTPNDDDEDISVQVERALAEDQDAAPDDHGYLTLVCDPACDDILDAGRSLGPSPVVHQPVAPGDHRLMLRRDGVAPKFVSVHVAPGKLTGQRMSMK